MRAARIGVLVGVLVVASSCHQDATAPAPGSPPTLEVPPYTGTLLAPERIAALPVAQRAAWTSYVDRSQRAMGADQYLVRNEMYAHHIANVVRPPNTPDDFTPQKSWTSAWVTSTAGRSLVATVLSYQTASGGWGKHIDYSKGVRAPGMGYNSESDEWAYEGTLDNFATVGELRLLAVAAANGDDAARAAVNRGVQYLLNAQFPSGCWPQVWPLMGGYHDAATHNDNANVNAVRLLRDIASGAIAISDATLRAQSAAAVTAAIGCMVAEQVVVNGVWTTWGQQHDPLTHAPVIGRSYEPPSLSGNEGAVVMELLMEEAAPSAEVVSAVRAAAAFYNTTAMSNVIYIEGTGLVSSAGAGPVWPRMMEIGTNRAIFSNRDGLLLYDYNQLTDRRTGYAWYSTEPANALRAYDTWAKAHAAR